MCLFRDVPLGIRKYSKVVTIYHCYITEVKQYTKEGKDEHKHRLFHKINLYGILVFQEEQNNNYDYRCYF